jgi:hypothetical protein
MKWRINQKEETASATVGKVLLRVFRTPQHVLKADAKKLEYNQTAAKYTYVVSILRGRTFSGFQNTFIQARKSAEWVFNHDIKSHDKS